MCKLNILCCSCKKSKPDMHRWRINGYARCTCADGYTLKNNGRCKFYEELEEKNG